ncbi:hypothetical protein KIPB_014508, partial [Kipferlia bialata]
YAKVESTFSSAWPWYNFGHSRIATHTQEIRRGSHLSDLDFYYVTGATSPTYVEMTQPIGVVCPQQDFSVSSQRLRAQVCAFKNTWFGMCPEGEGTYGSVYNTLSSKSRICPATTVPTTEAPLSVTIHRSIADTVTTVEFTIPSLGEAALIVIFLLVTMTGFHALVMAIVIGMAGSAKSKSSKVKAWAASQRDALTSVLESSDTDLNV